jgi:general secretion pathway protein J
MTPPNRTSGFTLIELLVAIAIFSFLATAMYTGIRQIVIERELVLQRTEELNQLQRAIRYLNTDLSQVAKRSVRDELGRDRVPALVSDPSEQFSLRLSRDGWRNPALFPRGTLQRVHYRLEDEKLIREYWPVMDRLLGEEARQLELLSNVEELELEFLDAEYEWQPDWPPAETSNVGEGADLNLLPRAIRYRITVAEFGEIERLVELTR